MIDFIISNRPLANPQKEPVIPFTMTYFLTSKEDKFRTITTEEKKIWIFGDCIASEEQLLKTATADIARLKGNFYAIIVENGEILVFSSFLNILPLYYTTDFKHISSSITYIREYVDTELQIDKKFILESLLFNYGFFNRTLFKEICLVPVNHHILIEGEKSKLIPHFETSTLFTSTPKRGRKVADTLSDLFIDTVKDYFPEDNFHIAFTSGFDGRTLVSCATHYEKIFNTFSFGRPENDDVTIPQENAEALQIPYTYFDLGTSSYIENAYPQNAKEYIKYYPGGNGYIYAHFLYSTKKVASASNYLLSGVMGSELFRALHITGAVTSKALVDVFMISDHLELKNALRESETLKVLDKTQFSDALEELLDEIIMYKQRFSSELPLNQQFYTFVLEEIFRKFFGQWVYLQMRYCKVRTPFLDVTFLKELMQSIYAGANNDFRTENPLKRIKGQYLYTDIIKKTNTMIYKQKTGKGYRPKDVREPLFLYNIFIPFFKKRISRKVKKTYLDNLGIISGAVHQKIEFKNLIEQTDWIDSNYLSEILENLSPYTKENQRDTLLMTLSLLQAVQHTSNTKPIGTATIK